MTDPRITEAIEAHRAALVPLAHLPWRHGGHDPRNIWVVTDDDRQKHVPIGKLDTPELAAEARAAHNAMLDISYLGGAGYGVEFVRHPCPADPATVWTVILSPTPSGGMYASADGGSPAEAVAKAREWAEEQA